MEKAASYRAELAVSRANEVKLKEVNTQLTGKLQNSENKQLVQLNEILEESFPTLGQTSTIRFLFSFFFDSETANIALKVKIAQQDAIQKQLDKKSDELKKVQRDMNQWKQRKAKQLEKKFKEELRKISDRAGLLIDDAESGYAESK